MIAWALQHHGARGEGHGGGSSFTRRMREALGTILGSARGDGHLPLDEHRGLRMEITQSGWLEGFTVHLSVISHAHHTPIAVRDQGGEQLVAVALAVHHVNGLSRFIHPAPHGGYAIGPAATFLPRIAKPFSPRHLRAVARRPRKRRDGHSPNGARRPSAETASAVWNQNPWRRGPSCVSPFRGCSPGNDISVVS